MIGLMCTFYTSIVSISDTSGVYLLHVIVSIKDMSSVYLLHVYCEDQ